MYVVYIVATLHICLLFLSKVVDRNGFPGPEIYPDFCWLPLCSASSDRYWEGRLITGNAYHLSTVSGCEICRGHKPFMVNLWETMPAARLPHSMVHWFRTSGMVDITDFRSRNVPKLCTLVICWFYNHWMTSSIKMWDQISKKYQKPIHVDKQN